MSANQEQPPQEKYDFQVALAIIGAGLANAITLLQINGPFTLWNTMVGVIILCILAAYRPAPTSRFTLNIAYAATWSITLLTTLGVFSIWPLRCSLAIHSLTLTLTILPLFSKYIRTPRNDTVILPIN